MKMIPMDKYSLQFSFLFSIEYLTFMLLCFGLLSFPAKIREAFQIQAWLIVIAGLITIATVFIK